MDPPCTLNSFRYKRTTLLVYLSMLVLPTAPSRLHSAVHPLAAFLLSFICGVRFLPHVPGKRLAHFTGVHGVVDEPIFVARRISPLQGDKPAIFLDALRTGGSAGGRRVPLYVSQEVGERRRGIEKSSV